MPLLSELARKRKDHGFSSRAEYSYLLPPSYYYDPAIYEREKAAIWYRNWIFVGLLADVRDEGSYFTAQIMDQKIYVIRARDGQVRAFYNVCQHRGHTLLEGRGKTSTIRCPFHAWTYDTFGNLKKAPQAEHVERFDYSEFCIPEIRCETLGPMVFVNLDDSARPLNETAGGLLTSFTESIPQFSDLRHVRTESFDVKANWKFIHDGLEFYHGPYIHPEVAATKNPYIFPRTSTLHEIWQLHRSKGNYELMEKHPEKLPYPMGPQTVRDLSVWYLWPNLVFASRQGPPNFQILEAVPMGTELSIRNQINFCLNEPPTEADLGHMNFYRDIVWPQDKEAMERQTAGIRSRGYIRGRHMVDAAHSSWAEHATHHFNNLVWLALNGPNYEMRG